jgi:DNA polymerase III alpha subunit
MSLRAMEPQLPALPEALMDTESLEDAYALADLADGFLPQFLSEQLPDEDAVRLLQEKCDAGLQRRLIAAGLATQKDPPRRRFR